MMRDNINTDDFTFQCINSETNEILHEGKVNYIKIDNDLAIAEMLLNRLQDLEKGNGKFKENLEILINEIEKIESKKQ